MFFSSNLFWFLMGMVAILVAFGFKYFAEDRGWVMTWWKWLLCIVWYGIFSLSFYTFGILAGENEGDAGFKIFLLGMFVSLVLAVGLWRLLALKPKSAEPTPVAAEA
ncbi:MAG: hypothetical protein R6X34_13505 [Chloroflexota bacterium]